MKQENILCRIFEYALSCGAFLLLWQCYVTISKVPEFILPSPTQVARSLITLISTGELWPHLWITGGEVLLGFSLGTLSGIALGYVFARVEVVHTACMPWLIFAQASPKIALVPLFVVWFGIGLLSKVILIISMVLFPVLAAMTLGIQNISHDSRHLMKVLGASPWQVFWHLEMPSSLPMLFAGMKNGIIQAVIGAIVAEWMSGKQGLGYLLTWASSIYDTPLLLAGIIATILLGILLYEGLAALQRRLLFWHSSPGA